MLMPEFLSEPASINLISMKYDTSVLKQTQRVECKGIYYDLIFTLLTYGYTSSMWASTLLAQVSGGADADKQYNKVADLLCMTAGIFAFVAEEVIPKWNSPDKNRPPKVVRKLPAVLSK
ncbi:hypothetical protein BC937DRAFT_88417 [Endogone sp. FLAS-F59071]|nr:hypothetical protein BC937DRAFT_88417 [Endogone sp. FLAS-F59071]|eukprot:RUS18724.1 hypothetical protein BC937DRAFT_88417 [Endogone sp. FLAS-F59071]